MRNKNVNKRRRLLLLCILCFCTLLLLLSLDKRGFVKQYQVWRQRKSLQIQIDALQEEKLMLEEECNRLKDPDRIEEVAREKYGMAKKNEKVYRIIPAD